MVQRRKKPRRRAPGLKSVRLCVLHCPAFFAAFTPVRVAPERGSADMVGGGAIEIELGSGLECGSQARSTGDADGSNRGASRWTAAMIGLPASARVWLATGYTDMRKDFSVAGLAGSR